MCVCVQVCASVCVFEGRGWGVLTLSNVSAPSIQLTSLASKFMDFLRRLSRPGSSEVTVVCRHS